MKAFKFKLQTSLNVCQRREQVAREELQACLAEKERLEQQLMEIRDKIQRLEGHIRKIGMSQETLMFREYLPVLHRHARQVQVRIQQADERVEKARLHLIEKKQETKSLEQLREKEWQEYLQEMNAEEQKTLDEVAITAHYRKGIAEVHTEMLEGLGGQ